MISGVLELIEWFEDLKTVDKLFYISLFLLVITVALGRF